jgi:4-hydroxyphenylpyruvate dioxygenase-like putative hemolysin
MPVVHEEASPGALGLSAYTWRVKDVHAAARRARAEGARAVTAVCRDEFGREAIGLRSPDGYFWAFIAA